MMNFENLKNFMDSLTSWRIPGNSISICVENKEMFKYQSGYENIEQGTKMTEGKLFNIYSCSKPVTAIAALQLMERGCFTLDTPIYDFIPEYRYMYAKKGKDIVKVKKPITIKDLLTMTSGFTYNLNSEGIKKARKITDGKMETLTVVKCMSEDVLEFEPGENWHYGMSLDIMAGVAEAITGKKFRCYVKENIFEPLEMNNSHYHNESVLENVSQQYRYVNSDNNDLVNLQSVADNRADGKIINIGKSVENFILGPEYDSGGAGMTASVEDMSKFASALANGGIGRNGERIISEKSIETMKKNHLNEKQIKNFNWQQLKGYSYGLGVRTMINPELEGIVGNIGEFGWGGAAGSTILVDTRLKLSMFYTYHMLNPQEEYYQPRLRNALYTSM